MIDFGSSNTTMGICLSDGSMRIATAKGKTIIPSVIGVQEKAGGETEFLFGYDAQEMNRQNYRMRMQLYFMISSGGSAMQTGWRASY